MDKKRSVAAENITVSVETRYLAEQSREAQQQYVFSYAIKICNNSDVSVQLLNRYWLITDANGGNSTVEGEGVVGEQPIINAGSSFSYSSGCLLKTPLGNMQGHYQMQSSDGQRLQVEIPLFRLVKPNILN